MKTLLLSLMLLVAVPAHAIIGHMGSSTNLDYAKAVVPESVEKIFINVKASAAISAGMVVSLDLTADDGATALVGPTSGLAPICVAPLAIASGALGKCQIYGLFDAALFDSTNSASVAGAKMYMSTNNAGYISARVTELASEKSIGYFYDVASASGSMQVFLNF